MAHGREDGPVQVVDILVQSINGLVALLLTRALVLDGKYQTLYSVRNSFGVRGKKLPSWRVVWIDSQALGGAEETVTGTVDVLSGHDDGLLSLSCVGTDSGGG